MDSRCAAWFEARKNIEASQKLTVEDPMYWAHLLCAVGNAVLCTMPDSVADEVEMELARRTAEARKFQKQVQKKIRDDLGQ